jgi:hypothetical protein
MLPHIDEEDSLEGCGTLKCPNCESSYLHQDRVEVFDRLDDRAYGVHVVVDGQKATVDAEMTGNPSADRQGLTIRFWCEECDAKPVLIIAQHEGRTFVEMLPLGRP